MSQRRRGQPALPQTWDTEIPRTPIPTRGHRGIEEFSPDELAELTAKAAEVLGHRPRASVPFHMKRGRWTRHE